MAGRVHEFLRGITPAELESQLGVFHPKKPVFGSHDVRRNNDRIFTGPRGAVQRYGASPAASQVVTNPYGMGM
jgi:hypothetical protein